MTKEPLHTNLKRPFIPSDRLPSLRRAIEAVELLRELIGPISEFHMVIDANIFIREIIWILDKRITASARTMLHECIVAGTIIPYVTPTIVSEVEEHLVAVAAKRKRDPATWLSEWATYKTMLRVSEPDPVAVEKYIKGQDPDDAPTLALAEMLSAFGILTADSDILAMGGNSIPISFVLEARDYSRKAAINLSIRVGGYYITIGTVQAVLAMVAAIKHGFAGFRRLPGHIKILAVVVMAFVILYPKSRNAIIAFLRMIGQRLPDALPLQILQTILYFADLAIENEATPPTLTKPE